MSKNCFLLGKIKKKGLLNYFKNSIILLQHEYEYTDKYAYCVRTRGAI